MTRDTDKIYTVAELSKFFGVAHKTIYEWCKSGKLPGFKIGKEWMVRASDLHKIIQTKIAPRDKRTHLF